MTGLAILDVAIGLIFVFLLLSLLCAVINEWIAQATRLRARTLRRGIETLLNDIKFKRVTESIYQHPLVLGLRHGERDPSYIPSALFAKAFLSDTERKLAAIGNDLTPESFLQSIDRIAEKYDQLKMEVFRKGQIVTERVTEAETVLEQMRQRIKNLRRTGATMAEIATAENQLATGEEVAKNAQRERDDFVKEYVGYAGAQAQKLAQLEAEQTCYRHVAEVLRAFITSGTATVEELERHLARWYDQAMLRVSGWYRRKMQLITFGVAALLALAFNADSIGMARTIFLDRDLRDMIQHVAQAAAQRCSLPDVRSGDAASCSVEELARTIEARRRLPIGWYDEAMPLARAVCPEGNLLRRTRDEARRVAEDAARTAEERTQAEGTVRRTEAQLSTACAPSAAGYGFWLLGLIITGIAVSFGATLVFDLLKRIMSLRTTGAPPPA